MANLNLRSAQERTYQAIVVGSGISGAWAAKELCDLGVKTLMLDRGPDVTHLKDYPTTNMLPHEFPHRGQLTEKIKEENPVISKCYAFREDAMHFFVKDSEHPYVKKSHLTGFGATKWEVSLSSGRVKYSAGPTLTLRGLLAMASP